MLYEWRLVKTFLIDEMKYLYIFAMTGFMNDPKEYVVFNLFDSMHHVLRHL